MERTLVNRNALNNEHETRNIEQRKTGKVQCVIEIKNVKGKTDVSKIEQETRNR